MYCVLCSLCSYNQFSSKERIGLFPLLAGSESNDKEPKEIRTPDFIRHEEDEIKAQQERIKNTQQFPSQFNCDKCSKPIPFTQEKEYQFTRYRPNTSAISDIRYCLLCPVC
jgi:hypothetical protein